MFYNFVFTTECQKVIVNLWSAHMDPSFWTEPNEFRPERFLNEMGEIINRDRMIAFSFGMLIIIYYFIIIYHVVNVAVC